jgi:hypothetical protein
MTDAIVLAVFLSAAIERVVEAFMGLAESDAEKEQQRKPPAKLAAEPAVVPKYGLGLKRFGAMAAGFALAAALCFGLDFQLINDFVETDLGEDEAKLFTAMLIGAGTAPAHEFIRFVEERKKAAEREVSGQPVVPKEPEPANPPS